MTSCGAILPYRTFPHSQSMAHRVPMDEGCPMEVEPLQTASATLVEAFGKLSLTEKNTPGIQKVWRECKIQKKPAKSARRKESRHLSKSLTILNLHHARATRRLANVKTSESTETLTLSFCTITKAGDGMVQGSKRLTLHRCRSHRVTRVL